MHTVSLGTLLLEHQPDDSFVLVKPIRAPNFLVQTAVQGAIAGPGNRCMLATKGEGRFEAASVG